MHPLGLTSVTFRKLTPASIAALAAEAKLEVIEWGGDVHVPPGDADAAYAVHTLTTDAGLRVSSYGSYYRAGALPRDQAGPAWDAVLGSAAALHAPLIRVWAGPRGSDQTDRAGFRVVADDLRRIAELAGARGVTVGLEYHGNTLTDTFDATRRLMDAVADAGVKLYWQPRTADLPAAPQARQLAELREHVVAVHVFHWDLTTGKPDRRPLSEGADRWRHYLAALEGRPVPLMMEFVRDDAEDALINDAATLRSWCH